MDTVIITRHKGAVEWLRLRGITGTVIEQAAENDVRGKRVIGALPMNLAALTASYVTIDMPKLKLEDRGKDLSPEEMDERGATMIEYVVKRK